MGLKKIEHGFLSSHVFAAAPPSVPSSRNGDKLVRNRSSVEGPLKIYTLVIRYQLVFITLNRNNGRQALANIGKRRQLLRQLHTIGLASQPLNRPGPKVRGVQQISDVGNAKKVDDSCNLQVLLPRAFGIKLRVLGEHSRHKGKMAARGMACHHKLRCVEPVFRGVSVNPTKRAAAIFYGGGSQRRVGQTIFTGLSSFF